LVNDAHIAIEYQVEGAVKVTAWRARESSAGGRRFRPVDGVHTRVVLGGRAVWVDVNTGEQCATSDLERGASRSKSSMLSRALASEWQWFGTLTVDGSKLPAGISRRSSEVVPHVYRVFESLRRSCPDFRYLVVPEQHKDGAFHFHCLLAGVPDSWTAPALRGREQVRVNGRAVFHFLPFQHSIGFTTLSRVGSSLRAGRYMGKYISKGMTAVNARGVGYRRWTCSHNCPKPNISRGTVDVLAVDDMHEISSTQMVDGSPVQTPLGVWVAYAVVGDVWLTSLERRLRRVDVVDGVGRSD
jgi:hypothetical protein